MEYKDEITSNINYLFNKVNNDDMNKLADLLISFKKKNIFLIGIGKSNNVCLHFSDLLNCINFNAIVLNSSNLLHGNMGCIRKSDIVICISKSGNTFELINILNIIKNKVNPEIILLSSNIGYISEIVNKTFIVPIKNESSFCFNLMPTNSIVIFIIFINTIIGKIIDINKTSKKEYIENHVSGDIGNQFKMVKDCLIKKEDCSILNFKHTIKEAIIDMNKKKIGISIIKDDDEKIVGIITNRDICIFLEKNNTLNTKLLEIMSKDFKFLNDEKIYVKDVNIDTSYLPVIKDNNLLGIIEKKNT